MPTAVETPRPDVGGSRPVQHTTRRWRFWAVFYGFALIYFGALDPYKPLPDYLNIYDTTVAVMLVWTLFTGRLSWPRSALFGSILLLIFARIVSVAASPFYEPSQWLSVFRYVEFAAVLALLSSLHRVGDIDALFGFLLRLSLVESVVAMAQFAIAGGSLRAFGFGNQRGLYELQILFILYFLTRRITSPGRGVAVDTAKIGVLVIGVLVSLTRTAWIELGVAGALAILFLSKLKQGFRNYVMPVFLMLGTVLLLLTMRQISPAAAVRFEQVQTREASLDERIALWTVALKAFSDHPILGVGSGAYARNLDALTFDAGVPSSRMGQRLSAHNNVLGMLAETGVLGIAAYALYAGSVLLLSIRILRHSICSIRSRRSDAACMEIAVAVSCVSFIAVDSYAVASFTPFSATIIGLLLAIHRKTARSIPPWPVPTSVSSS